MDGTWTQNVEFSVKAWYAGKTPTAGYRNLNSPKLVLRFVIPRPLFKGGYKTWWANRTLMTLLKHRSHRPMVKYMAGCLT